MATILFAWELGAGIGHIARYVPLVPLLRDRGHEVVFALRDLARAERLLGPVGASYVQAPFKVAAPRAPIEPTHSYPQLLHNVGYEEPGEARALVLAWRKLWELVRPDVVVCDHSPTALVALRGLAIKKIVMGTGFTIPPDVEPMPSLHPWSSITQEQLRKDEGRVLGVVNEVLATIDQPALPRLGRLFAETDEALLTTFRELDHYASREGALYWGFAPPPAGATVAWPDSPRRKVFAYLKPFPTLPTLLELLAKLEVPTIVAADGIDAKTQERFATQTLRFVNQHVDLPQVLSQCYMSILNATHSTTATALLAGKPVLLFPLSLEQEVFARRVADLGAGALIPYGNEWEVFQQTANVLNDDRYALAARRFASTYQGFDCQANVARWAHRIDEILAARTSRDSGATST